MFDFAELAKTTMALGQIAASYYKTLIVNGVPQDVAIHMSETLVSDTILKPLNNPKSRDEDDDDDDGE